MVGRWTCYGHAERPLSSGRITLAEALEALCLDRWFLEPVDIVAAFSGDDASGTARLNFKVRTTIVELGRLFMNGVVPTFVRPFGGGLPQRLPAAHWEIDEFVPRFATSAMDPQRWADAAAEPTHWILVNSAIFEAWLWEHSSDAFLRRPDVPPPPTSISEAKAGVSAEEGPSLIDDRIWAPVFLRLDEVLTRTGMRRTALYDRVQSGSFPRQRRKVGERTVFWLESEVIEWQQAQLIGNDVAREAKNLVSDGGDRNT